MPYLTNSSTSVVSLKKMELLNITTVGPGAGIASPGTALSQESSNGIRLLERMTAAITKEQEKKKQILLRENSHLKDYKVYRGPRVRRLLDKMESQLIEAAITRDN